MIHVVAVVKIREVQPAGKNSSDPSQPSSFSLSGGVKLWMWMQLLPNRRFLESNRGQFSFTKLSGLGDILVFSH